MFLPKAASDFQDKMDQFKKAAEGFKGQVRQSCHCKIVPSREQCGFSFGIEMRGFPESLQLLPIKDIIGVYKCQ